MPRALITAAKWIWMVGLLGVVTYLLAERRNDISALLAQANYWYLMLSFVCTTVAKLLLAETARAAAVKCGINISWPTAARLYNLSQLGKYLPGSVWHYAGRVVAYRDLGAAYATIRDALLIETVWVVGASIAAASVLGGPLIFSSISRVLTSAAQLFAGIVLGALILASCVLLAMQRIDSNLLSRALPSFALVVVQTLVWLLLGMAFLLLAKAFSIDLPAAYASALYASAYVIGFLVPIAPAGLGVRDAVLAAGLVKYGPSASIVLVIVASRAIYMCVEILMVLVQESIRALRRSGNVAQKVC
jgi:glycosyltransferase 2 family protein